MKIVLVTLGWLVAFAVNAAESHYDSYEHATECPANGQSYVDNSTADSLSFIRCQCVSYVADKLSEFLTTRYYNNGAPNNLVKSFKNGSYYMPQNRKWSSGDNAGQNVTRWSHARYWRDSALYAGIGVTGARDNFTWDEKSYNAVFKGDVAWWDKWNDAEGAYGHVAFVEDFGMDATGKGVAWVTVSEYNFSPKFQFSRRTLYKSNHPNPRFPDAFIHIDRDHAYCTANPTKDNCSALWGGQMIASSDSKADGLGGGSTDTFNLKVNSFWVADAAGAQLVADTTTLKPGQAITVKVQVKSKDGNTSAHMRPGKSRIEVDIYVRQGVGDWTFLKREYVQASNLPNGATHTESATYTIPQGVNEVSFKAKIDAEDEAYEANEGDNWSEVKTFRVFNPALFQTILNLLLED